MTFENLFEKTEAEKAFLDGKLHITVNIGIGEVELIVPTKLIVDLQREDQIDGIGLNPLDRIGVLIAFRREKEIARATNSDDQISNQE